MIHLRISINCSALSTLEKNIINNPKFSTCNYILLNIFIWCTILKCFFYLQYSVVKFWDRRDEEFQNKHLFFIFFEWKNNIIEQSYLIYTTTPWSIGAGLCGVFLTLHRGFVLAKTSYKRVQKEKERKKIRRQTIRDLKKQKSMEAVAALERYAQELACEK